MPEENFNKSLLLIIINDSQVIVRVLNSNSDIPYFITASKITTIDFTRNELGLPVPKILVWNLHALENPVEVEYIIIEKAADYFLVYI
ncbi:uncharacterized protein CIMG_13496 [Coccidioides immitis RS]|uniref:Uncharacterized protein n=1 Tax=Coccidioides immitis (strain RS) TaxID=246410 RepID=J3K0C8_COCIM|nr:uncharacterized protein CIMG_13496 [Coccidioides immitis RS]EAS27286.3 hypothetical protein CIMG_13496 [Coccidioides immitis RS]